MNIVRLLGRKSFITTLVGCSVAIIALQFALTPQRVNVTCDQRWAFDVQKSITKKIELFSLRTVGIRKIHEILAQEFPCLKDITITYSSRLLATVVLQGWRPLVHVRSSLPGNLEYIICERGTILPKKYFQTTALIGLPTIVIELGDFEEKLRAPAFVRMALDLKESLYDTYQVIWHSKAHIILQDKEKPITITADITSIHDADRYAYVQSIYDQEKKYQRGMKADIRLKDSLVCAPQKKRKSS